MVIGEDDEVVLSSDLASEPQDSLVLAPLGCLWGAEEMESFLTFLIWTWRLGGTRMVLLHSQDCYLSCKEKFLIIINVIYNYRVTLFKDG